MILISPWSRDTTDRKPSPKNYPKWAAVVAVLRMKGLEVRQVSCTGEPEVQGCQGRWDNLRLRELYPLVQGCDTWISVDNFWHHMAWTIKEPGVAIFGSSDPLIFGHTENINLLKDRSFLREKQFWLWSQTTANPEMWVGPDVVVSATLRSIEQRKLARR